MLCQCVNSHIDMLYNSLQGSICIISGIDLNRNYLGWFRTRCESIGTISDDSVHVASQSELSRVIPDPLRVNRKVVWGDSGHGTSRSELSRVIPDKLRVNWNCLGWFRTRYESIGTVSGDSGRVTSMYHLYPSSSDWPISLYLCSPLHGIRWWAYTELLMNR